MDKRAVQFVFVTVIAVVILAVLSVAQGKAQMDLESWEGNLGLSFLATSGNTDTQSLGFDLKIVRQPTPWGVEITTGFNRVEESGDKTAERYYAGTRAKRTLDTRWDVFSGVSGEKDVFAGYDHLILMEAGCVYNMLLGPLYLLSFDVGITWTGV